MEALESPGSRRDVKAEAKMIALESKLRGIAFLFRNTQQCEFTSTSGEMQGIGFLLEDIANSLEVINNGYLLYYTSPD